VAALYFAAQATAGALWWIAVFVSDDVRRLTLGGWDVALVGALDIPLFVVASAITATTRSTRWAVVTASWTVAVTVALSVYALATRTGGWGAFLMALAAGATVAAATVIAWGHVPIGWFFVGPFSFRPAPERSRVSNAFHSLAQLVTFWTVFFVLLPSTLGWTERRLHLNAPVLSSSGVRWFGLAVFALGSAVGVWSCLSMAVLGEGTPLPSAAGRRLVVTGPYRFVRNPMAVAGAAQTVGAGLYLGSWTVVLSALVGGLMWDLFIRPAEEADLSARFGEGYNEYRQRVRCWVPAPPQVR
jgi:protein-S-isoprenylcysteine O-methyltransferase Ste14